MNNGKLDLKKKSTDEMVKLFEKHSFPKKTGGYDDGSGYSYLLNQKIVAFSTECVAKIEAQVAEKEQELKHVQGMKVGEGAKIYVGNLEHDLEEDYDARSFARGWVVSTGRKELVCEAFRARNRPFRPRNGTTRRLSVRRSVCATWCSRRRKGLRRQGM